MLDPVAAYLRVNRRKVLRGLTERLLRCLPARLWAFVYVLRVLRSSKFDEAFEVVRNVSQDPSTRNMDSWTGVARATAAHEAWGENMYRGLAARVALKDRSPEASLLIELAYLAYKRRRG